MSDVSGYPLVSLNQVTRRITDGSHFSPTPQKDGPLIANVKDMKSGEIDFSTCTRISPAAYRELKATGCTIKNGNVLLSKDGTVGRIVVYSQDDEIGALSSICIIDPTNQLDASFLGQALQSEGCIRQYDNFMSGSALRRLVLRDIRSIKIPLPEPESQRSIAQVLDTLDTTIHETEAIIAKLKAVKQGLLHDLLTSGIEANGELRPPQAEAPHLYKQSPLGWIPKEWTCKPFGELCESSAFGPRFPSDAYDENGPLATLRTTDMDDEGNISLSTMPRAAIKPWVFTDHLLRPGDIVISRSGTCGVTGVFTGHDIPVVPGAFLIRFRLRDLRLNRFYRRYFNSSLGRPHLERLAVGGVQKNIKGSDVLCLQVPNPEPTEAVAIGDHIESVEYDIESNQQLLRKLLLQKSGLMDDLLTGRVRITPLLTETAR